MNDCDALDRYLEDRFSGDGPDELPAELRWHAEACARCRTELEAERTLEGLGAVLRADAATVPAAASILAGSPIDRAAPHRTDRLGWLVAAASLALATLATAAWIDARGALRIERARSAAARQVHEHRPAEDILARDARIRDLANELNEYRSKIEHLRAQGIDVARLAETKVPAPLDGKVVAVHAGLGLVMVNLGEKHGVEKGLNFTVYRGEAYVGQIIVEEVFPDMASARIDPRFQKLEVRESDHATTRIR